MKLSIGGYSFRNTMYEGKMDIYGYLETVKYRYGLDTVDFWNGQFANRSFEAPEEEYIFNIREALEEREMTLVNYAIDGAHIWDPDPEKRENLYQNALQHLKIGEILGAKTIRIDTGGHFGSHPDFSMSMEEEQFEYIVNRYKEFCDRAANLGYKIGPENHTGPSLSPKNLKKIAEAVHHPSFGILLHMGRWQEDESIGDEMVAPWVCHTHFDARTATAENGVSMIRMLKDIGYDGYWSIEHNAEKHQYIEIEWLLGAVKRLIKKAEI
ncbi:sugar phosphate isomerase/epimerase [Lederbergia sp. NSJ-179]|uniref:sugar phosphate isomerase/epimerase family protein n=1 Tax=Lederbergia sp. NSJ-179 TaxID=2931402 RepID=UPI001FD5530F|nr:TIM barrel protein [Lederbergia sp. NSJ-179]MCJ7840256.1 sugar phosphate isomerase/epimerase [Lederbergia sp. NSJ-179]